MLDIIWGIQCILYFLLAIFTVVSLIDITRKVYSAADDVDIPRMPSDATMFPDKNKKDNSEVNVSMKPAGKVTSGMLESEKEEPKREFRTASGKVLKLGPEEVAAVLAAVTVEYQQQMRCRT